MYEDKENTNFLLVLFTSIIYVFIAIFVIFFIGLSKVDAATWVEFRTEGDGYLCGTNTDNLSCKYSTNIIGYNLIIEEIQLSANKTYELEIYWNLETAISKGDYDGYINETNWKNFTATITGKYWGANGPLLPTKNKTWQLLNAERYFDVVGDSLDTAKYTYKYTNVFELSSDQNYQRLYFEVRKRQQWNSIGIPPILIPLNDPVVILSQFTYVLSEIGDNGVANIIASGNKNTEDILNNQNQNTQQIIDSVTNPDVNGSNDTIGGFFDSFSDTDHGGLSGIITAPLIAFNQMLTGTCNDLSVEYKGSTTTLPCGTSFWNQISPIRDFLNITLGGLICYQIVRKLFLLIQKIKNPDDDRVEVMSL